MAQSANEVKKVITGWMDDMVGNIHTAMPGKIISYDAGMGRADVQPVGQYKLEDGRGLPYPVIHGAPVIFPPGCGGNVGVTFPLQSGDGCLLVFAEGQLDDFLSGGDSSNGRRHDINDAICIPGLYNSANLMASGHPSEVCVFNGDVKMCIGSGGITVTGGDLVVNGISVIHHTHPGDSGGTTGGPQ